MPLSDYKVGAVIPVSDMDEARAFYEGKLGLTAAGEDPDGGRTYSCAGGTTIHVYAHPGGAGASPATVAGWTVDEIESVVEDLSLNGVGFEHYDEPPMVTDEKGIVTFGTSKVAWFKDPDGNVLGLIQP
jgi:catechol 2,3-dioxygenase-like lactoylglutathione lyase family enzyme